MILNVSRSMSFVSEMQSVESNGVLSEGLSFFDTLLGKSAENSVFLSGDSQEGQFFPASDAAQQIENLIQSAAQMSGENPDVLIAKLTDFAKKALENTDDPNYRSSLISLVNVLAGINSTPVENQSNDFNFPGNIENVIKSQTLDHHDSKIYPLKYEKEFHQKNHIQYGFYQSTDADTSSVSGLESENRKTSASDSIHLTAESSTIIESGGNSFPKTSSKELVLAENELLFQENNHIVQSISDNHEGNYVTPEKTPKNKAYDYYPQNISENHNNRLDKNKTVEENNVSSPNTQPTHVKEVTNQSADILNTSDFSDTSLDTVNVKPQILGQLMEKIKSPKEIPHAINEAEKSQVLKSIEPQPHIDAISLDDTEMSKQIPETNIDTVSKEISKVFNPISQGNKILPGKFLQRDSNVELKPLNQGNGKIALLSDEDVSLFDKIMAVIKEETPPPTPKTIEPFTEYSALRSRIGMRVIQKPSEFEEMSKSFLSPSDEQSEISIIPRSIENSRAFNQIEEMFKPAPQPVHNQIGKEIAARISTMENGATTFEMELNPGSLGKIVVKLVSDSGKVSVEIVAERPETASLLKERSEHLITTLKDGGVNLESYEVATPKQENPFREGGGNQHHKEEHHKGDAQDNDADENLDFEEFLRDVI